MSNKRCIIIVIVSLFLIALTAKYISSFLYEGFIFTGYVKTGVKTESCVYNIEISKNLDVQQFEQGIPVMGVALEWDSNLAELDVTIHRTRGQIEEVLQGWKEDKTLERGTINVLPGDKFKIEVTATLGESDFLLKVFKPDETSNSAKLDAGNTIGGMVFYRIKPDDVNTIYSFTSGIDTNGFQGFSAYGEEIHVYTGTEKEFITNSDLNGTIQVNNIKLGNFLVLDRQLATSQINNYYAICDEKKTLEIVDIETSFSTPKSIHIDESHEYSHVRFDQNSQYLLLFSPDRTGVDLQVTLYESSDSEKMNPIRVSSRLFKNCNILLANDLDYSKDYTIIVTLSSARKSSATYMLSHMNNGEFKKIELNFEKVSYSSLQISKPEGTKVLWYAFKPKVVGENEVNFNWFVRHNEHLVQQAAEVPANQILLLQNGSGIYWESSNNDIDCVQIKFISNNLETTYFLKVVLQARYDYELNVKGLEHISTYIAGNDFQNSMNQLLVDLFFSDEMSWEQYLLWYGKFIGTPDISYQLFDIFVKLGPENGITSSILKTEFDRLHAITVWDNTAITQELIALRERNILDDAGLRRYLQQLLRLEQDVQKILLARMLQVFQVGYIDCPKFTEWLNEFVQVDFAIYTKPLENLLMLSFERGYLSWNELEKLKWYEENRELTIDLALKVLGENALQLDEFRNICIRLIPDMPEWFGALCDWGTVLKKENKSLTEADLTNMFSEAGENNLVSLQRLMEEMWFFASDTLGSYNLSTKAAIRDIKSFYNHYYSGSLVDDGSINYDIISRFCIVYIQHVKQFNLDEMPYWYREYHNLASNLADDAVVLTLDSLTEHQVWYLQHMLNLAGGNILTINGTNSDETIANLKKFKKNHDFAVTSTLNRNEIQTLLNTLYQEAVKGRIDAKRAKQVMNDPTPIWPCTRLAISSPYGIRLHPVDKVTKGHNGIDILPSETDVAGDQIKTIADGKVTFRDKLGDYGNVIYLVHEKHGTKLLQTRYAHLTSYDVKRDDNVIKQDDLGKMGETGKATAVHLHFEIRLRVSDDINNSNKSTRAIDPFLIYDSATVDIVN